MKNILANLNKQCMTACLLAMTATSVAHISLQPAQADDAQDIRTYHNSAYKYCDAKKIAAAWNITINGAMTLIGNKLNGANVVGAKSILDSAISRTSGTRCTYRETEVSYSDAQLLAGYWGRSVSDAKSKIVDIASDKGTAAVNRIIGSARTRANNAPINDNSCQQMRGTRSPGTDQAKTTVIFKNQTNQTRLVNWIDYQGKSVRYKNLQPGQSYKQRTFVSHVWRVTDDSGNCIQMSAAKSGADTVSIRR